MKIIVATKAGFLTPAQCPNFLKPEDVSGGMHSMQPDFTWRPRLNRKPANLGLETIDIFYLHNPKRSWAL